eukprot:TRINITY_DN1024_c0_g1_i3.p1 TRINITY_DN1024_c0_g1~~TRINITY_DN1024_c0_g1_i3.p1  ORF type:complete len:898 (+),score=239.59 TRINITY_DN1024_c0_g1_i3:384-3077(+)
MMVESSVSPSFRGARSTSGTSGSSIGKDEHSSENGSGEDGEDISLDTINSSTDLGRILQHDLNCLGDDDRNKRLRSIRKIVHILTIVKEKQVLDPSEWESFGLERLLRPVLKRFEDRIERIRESAVDALHLCIDASAKCSRFLAYIVPVLRLRIAGVEVLEQSEEVRLKLVNMTHILIHRTASEDEALVAYLDDVAEILKKMMLDAFPTIRRITFSIINDFAELASHRISLIAPTLCKTLMPSLRHQHSKIRRDAVRCYGTLVYHGGRPILEWFEESIKDFRDVLKDGNPGVRQELVDIVGTLLTEWDERLSYEARLLPFLLCSLADAVETIRESSWKYMQNVGHLYREYHEKEIDEVERYHPELVAAFPVDAGAPELFLHPLTQRPPLEIRLVVQEHFRKYLKSTISGMEDWNEASRALDLTLLWRSLWFVEENVTEHLEQILSSITKLCQEDDTFISSSAVQVARLIGFYCHPKSWLTPLLTRIRAGSGFATNMKRDSLFIMRSCISGMRSLAVTDTVLDIMQTLMHSDLSQSSDTSLRLEVISTMEVLMKRLSGVESVTMEDHIMGFLLVLLPSCADGEHESVRMKAELLLGEVARLSGHENRSLLFERHFGDVFMLLVKSHEKWNTLNPEFIMLETLIRVAGSGCRPRIDKLVSVLIRLCHYEHDGILRVRSLNSLTHLIVQEDLREELQRHCASMLEHAVLPNCKWRPGSMAQSVRFAAATTLRALFVHDVIQDRLCIGETYMTSFLPIYLSLLDDDESEVRVCAIHALESLIRVLDDWIDDEFIGKTYPEILKRMDDNVDSIRLQTAEILLPFVRRLTTKSSSTYKQCMIDVLLVHLDDPWEELQNAVFLVLEHLGSLYPDYLRKECEKARTKHRSSHLCERLITLTEQHQ